MRWLSLTLWLPAAGALVLAFVPRARERWLKGIALGTSLLAFVVSLIVLGKFDAGEAAFQLAETERWIGSFGAQYALGIDGISLWLVLLTTFLFPVCVVASWNMKKNPKLFMALMLVLETAVLGVFLARDLLLFYVFWEGMLVPMYFLIGYWGYERRIYAAVKFFVFTLLGGLVMLAGVIVLAFNAREQLGAFTFSYDVIFEQVSLSAGTQRWLFLAFFLSFAIKVPLFPVHTWLPDAHTEAPTAGSVILAGVLLKMGGYGMIRYGLGLFPEAARDFATPIVILALIGIVYGALVAMMQKDLKRLVAYSSVSHLGFVVLGIFAFSTTAMQGASLQMISHGLSTGALFLIVGMLYERRHTRLIADYGGVASVAPVLSGMFLVAALSSLGLPGLNGFIGEFLILVGTFSVNKLWAIVAAVGVILAAVYLLWAYQRVMQGPVTIEQNRTIADLSARERLVLIPVMALIVLIGVWPRPFLDRMEASIERLQTRVAEQDGPLAEGGR